MSAKHCHLCGCLQLDIHCGYSRLQRVTSDCKPWPSGGRLATCRECGCTQAICDDVWQAEIRQIYDNYSIYYQGAGDEQKVFDLSAQKMLPRSEVLIRNIRSVCALAEKGKALDVGCGNGAFLKAFGAALPNWELYGTEYNAKYKEVVEALPGVRCMFTGPLNEAGRGFAFLSLVHVLEHIDEPAGFLRDLKTIMIERGLLFIELPSWIDNPFELLIADHATHFTCDTASRLLAESGFQIVCAGNSWIQKEISVVGSPNPSPQSQGAKTLRSDFGHVEKTISWLEATAAKARDLSHASDVFGIFGTSIASTWLTAEIEISPDFYVDEDPARIGGSHFGVPILAPEQVPESANVFIAQSLRSADSIAARLAGMPGQYEVPDSI